MTEYAITNVDEDGIVFLARVETRALLTGGPYADSIVSTRKVDEARVFGSRSAASNYADHFELRRAGWAVDSVLRFKR